jgi:membrane protein YdbS with pleckstrin-like domain
MIYHSKSDTWLVVIIALAIITPLLTGIYDILTSTRDPSTGWSSVLISLLCAAFILGMIHPLYYEIADSTLKIRCGLFIRENIPLSAIAAVYPTHNPLGAPAMSLDRLRINYKRNGKERFELISPKDKEGFMQELVSREAGLEQRGDRLIRIS